jgi:hypothetical protein
MIRQLRCCRPAISKQADCYRPGRRIVSVWRRTSGFSRRSAIAGMTAREGEQRPVKPVYLSGVLTVEAELSAGRLYDGSTYAETPRVSSSRWSLSGPTPRQLGHHAAVLRLLRILPEPPA